MTWSTAKWRRGTLLFLLLVLVWGFSGCATGLEEVQVPPEQLAAYLQDKPQELHPIFEKVLRQGSRNKVLHLNQAGVAAMSLGHWDLARECFNESILQIEAVYANNEQAEKARGLWREEKSKDFKGEPYERAMAYYYLGILDMMKGDYENARASFKNGILQDSFAEDEQPESDFALLMFLEGWCSQQLGQTQRAQESYTEVKKHLPGFTPPPADHNMLLLAETGNSPTKFADGQDRSMLRFGRGIGFSEDGAAVAMGGRQVPASPMGDIGYQATTRGGRQMDGVLEGKVRFKEINQAVGTVLQTGGLIALQAGLASNNRDMAIVGGVIALVGLAQMIMAESVKPNADVRHWTNLPDKVHILTGKYTLPGPAIPVLPRKGKKGAPPESQPAAATSPQSVQVLFLTSSGSTAGSTQAPVHVIKNGKSALIWAKDRSAVKDAFIDQ